MIVQRLPPSPPLISNRYTSIHLITHHPHVSNNTSRMHFYKTMHPPSFDLQLGLHLYRMFSLSKKNNPRTQFMFSIFCIANPMSSWRSKNWRETHIVTLNA